MPNASIVLCMDTSNSMNFRNYIDPAKTDAATFVNIMQQGDSLGVTRFNDTAGISYPPSSGVVEVINDQTDQGDATSAIMALVASGNTNITAGLNTSSGMLTSSANPKAIVLLSDGEYNVGGDPLNSLPPLQVYTIALGNNGQIQTLQQIASQTGGTFHLAPTPFDLADIYNEIIGQTQVANVIANQKQTVPQNNFWTLSATVASGTPEATFSISWTDWSVKYTSGTPTGSEINVSLRDPNGNTIKPTPFATGNGFVVFKIQSPAAGIWQAAIWSSAAGTLGTTGGAFDPHLDVNMQVHAPMNAVIGQSIPITATIAGSDGKPITTSRVSARLEIPTISPEDAVTRHRKDLDELARNHDFQEEVSDNVLMLSLQTQRGPGNPLIPYQTIPLDIEKSEAGGEHKTSIAPKTKGAHIVRLEATGVDPSTNQSFSLTRRISMWADHA